MRLRSYCLPALLLLLIAAVTHAGPVIELSTDTVDFGEIRQDTIHHREVIVRNTGNAILSIEKVQTSCGCTATTLGVQDLAPGESTPLKITYSSGQRSGLQDKTVSIASNAENTPITRLRVRSVIVPDFRTQPASTAFGTHSQGATPTLTHTVTATQGATPRIARVSWDERSMDVTYSGGDGKPVTVTTTLKPDLPIGDMNQSVIIHWEGDRKAHIIQYHAEIVGPIAISPKAATFVGREGTQPTERAITVSSLDKTAFDITGIENRPAWLSYTVKPGSGLDQVITLTIDPAAAPERYREPLTITTSHPAMPELELRLWVMRLK